MSDIQADLPVVAATPAAEGLENASHTAAGEILPVEVIAPPAVEGADAPAADAAAVNASILVASTPGPLDTSYIRDELSNILFGVKSGVTNGIDGLTSLILHVESKM